MSIRKLTIPLLIILLSLSNAGAGVVWMEAEGFAKTGKWSNDSQHVDLMGSPYLLATGLGKPVADAVTTAKIPTAISTSATAPPTRSIYRLCSSFSAAGRFFIDPFSAQIRNQKAF